MSYNVSHIEVLSGSLQISVQNARMIMHKFEESLPEINSLYDMELDDLLPDTLVLFKPTWQGDFSGRTYKDIFLEKILPLTVGRLEAIVTWEDGDCVTGLRVIDGVVTEPKVKQALED